MAESRVRLDVVTAPVSLWKAHPPLAVRIVFKGRRNKWLNLMRNGEKGTTFISRELAYFFSSDN